MKDTFGARADFLHAGKTYRIARLDALAKAGYDLACLPFSMRVLLENLLRREDGLIVRSEDVMAVAAWRPVDGERPEIAFMPGRVLLQDFTGVPTVVDLAAMRDAMARLGGKAERINPLQPVELVIDHSVQVDAFAVPNARAINNELDFQRNAERYAFLRWGQMAFENFKVVPPDAGIVHQVNLEFLARVVMHDEAGGSGALYPDTVVGTDSHTTMINGLGVLGWGVGGIEAEAAMLGQPVSMLIPDVVGVRITGKLPEGATSTDLVLRATEILRKHGVVGKFVEFFGPALAQLSLADRATIANMAPEYGATCGFFPVDKEAIEYLRFTGRADYASRAEAYLRAQGLFVDAATPEPQYSALVALDLSTVEPSLAGPKRPQDRVALGAVATEFKKQLPGMLAGAKDDAKVEFEFGGGHTSMGHGAVVIAAITSCTNTSNPSVMLAAGLVARKAVALGLTRPPHVKTSLAPGSKVVTRYLDESGLSAPLRQLGFETVGYGCTTCIGNSGPLPEAVAAAIDRGNLVAAAVLSGNRNFEGRIHAQVKANYLASPPLVVAYALAGRVDFDPTSEPIGNGTGGKPVFLRDIWPTQAEVKDVVRRTVESRQFEEVYADIYAGSELWQSMPVPLGKTFTWDKKSTYVRHPPYFEGMGLDPEPVRDITGARVLAVLGDMVTTDHISPAGSIKKDGPAGRYLIEHGVAHADFNSYGSRRGNHEVMVRGTFANIRIRNGLVPGVEGGVTEHLTTGERLSIYDAAMRYAQERIPLVVLAGQEYGAGSSRDWAAKGPALLGVRAVIAQSFERIHRSNLVGMGILPLEFPKGEDASTLGLAGRETFEIVGLGELLSKDFKGGGSLPVVAIAPDGRRCEFNAIVRIDTPQEGRYFEHGGILRYVLRTLLKG